ncbi:MAG TPA: hypothetical protein VK582_01550 [Pyrinomonadaceae bacterium]|nr:hypothetical protein [Pyrinomonadaceae bacterium]
MSAFVFSKNIDRLRSNHSYHEGLQRLARGILPPLLLASYVVYRYQTPKWGLLIGFLLGLALSACFLVRHSVRVEYDQMVRYFLVLTHLESSVTAKAIPGART